MSGLLLHTAWYTYVQLQFELRQQDLQEQQRGGEVFMVLAVICKELVGIANNGAMTGHNAMVRLPGIYGARGGRSAYEPSCALLLWEQEQCVGVQPGGCRCSLHAVLPAPAPLLVRCVCSVAWIDACSLARSLLVPFYCTSLRVLQGRGVGAREAT